jgi:hypothetical protein
MGELYNWGYNPIQDFLFNAVINNVDISDKKMRNDLDNTISYILETSFENENDGAYLDYDIVKTGNKYKVIGNNIITALWFLGIPLSDVRSIIDNNSVIIGDRRYKFNNKTKKLSYLILKN